MADDLALDTRAEAAATPEKAVRRWMLELKLAQKREKDWRKTARNVLDVYRGKNRKKNSFNILWANTEVLRPALYNSPPKPDVRRRFRQSDMLGKAVSEVMERSVSYCVDAYDLDNVLQNDVLDALLPGRGVSRIRYVPKFKQIPPAQSVQATKPADGEPSAPSSPDSAAGGTDGNREEVEYEQALCDHVQWDDFLHGPGKTWEEVQWVGFRARLSRDDLIEKFGEEIGGEITLNDVDEADVTDNAQTEDLREVFKRAELWEIWDKEGKKVFFVNESYKKDLLYPVADKDDPAPVKKGEPPLKLKNFFPVPRPLQLVEDTGTLIPQPIYELYREQAEELDRVCARINKIVNACRVRFVHDSTLTELKALMDAGDNEGIPAESARAWMTNGGLEKAIWFMPVEKIAQVLRELYAARDLAKQTIYELTGISDILRGATDPNETLGAQQLKANSSSLRLQRMVAEVQRYSRDLIRLLAEVIGENFDPQTLSQMTGLKFPTNVQKQQIQLQMQTMQQQMAQPGAQPPPEVAQKMQQAHQAMQMPTVEDIMGVLRSDIAREYRVDVETDSTVAQSLQQDMAGMREVLTGIVEFWQGVGPAVQAGAVSIEAVKAITMSVVRRARMGLEVEDALESGMQEPKQAGDPKAAAEAQKQQQVAQEAKQQAQLDAQQQAFEQKAAQAEEQRLSQVELAKHQREQEALRAEERMEAQRAQYEARIARNEAMVQQETELKKAALQVAGQIEIARINAKSKAASEAAKAAQAGAEREQADSDGAENKAAMDSVLETQRKLLETLAAPKEIVRGPDGRATGVRIAA